MGGICCKGSSVEVPTPAKPISTVLGSSTCNSNVPTDENAAATAPEDVPVEVRGQSAQRHGDRPAHSNHSDIQQGAHKAEVRAGISYAQAIKHADGNHGGSSNANQQQVHNSGAGTTAGASTSQPSAQRVMQGAGVAAHQEAGAATGIHAEASHAPHPLFGTLLVDRSWKTIHGKVVSVADGDTVDVLSADGQRHRIRMAFSDAPETKQNYGPESKVALNAQIYKEIVTVYVADTDQYQRVVGVVVKDSTGEDMNLSQILHGNAWFYSFYSGKQPKAMKDAYSQAEIQAKAAKRGLWADANPENPRQWRIAHPRDDK